MRVYRDSFDIDAQIGCSNTYALGFLFLGFRDPKMAGYEAALEALLKTKSPLVGASVDFSDPTDPVVAGRKDIFDLFLAQWGKEQGSSTNSFITQLAYENDPVADLYVPLFDDFSKADRRLVGVLTCVVYWRTYFVNIVAENAHGITVVLENTCNQIFSYQIDGSNVTFLGPGDLHDHQFENLEVATSEEAFLQVQQEYRNVSGSCLYSIRIYPSVDLQSTFVTERPVIYTVVLASIFLFTSCIFLLYDCIVERRNRLVVSSAIASNAIVSSLFPKTVRARLYKNKTRRNSDRSENVLLSEAQKAMNQTTNPRFDERNMPIADLFHDCTVLFADICGFTSWSSGRQPTEVFFLLETIYGAFDKVAKKAGVFKVETIGDCYLAVTGLPEPQPDHAVRMVRFCVECVSRLTRLVENDLQNSLDASSLSMRFGMHSGPVTAGVLRGEKSRFQLFGDTVNTAARMESSGEPGKIHVSDDTAKLLILAGKQDWLEERGEESIEVKGKGSLRTYWIKRGKKKSSASSEIRTTDDVASVRYGESSFGDGASAGDSNPGDLSSSGDELNIDDPMGKN